MAGTPKIEKKIAELTEAEKAAKASDKVSEEQKKEQEQLEQRHRDDAQKALEETKSAAQDAVIGLKIDIAPEQINDLPTLENTLGLKIREVPKSVPAYLDMIVEKNPKLLEVPGVSTLIAQKMQELLLVISTQPELAHDRDWMNSLRQTLNRIVIDPTLSQKITDLSRMDEGLRQELQSQLGIENITEGLDANTRDIVQKVHTGFYRFDPEVNTWVNSLGAFVFLWPENIAGIKKYLTAMQPNHPFLSVTNYHSSDKEAGKYAVVFDGRPDNMMLAESDYLVRYMQLRAQGMNDAQVFEKLGLTHVANLADQAAVQKSLTEFKDKYGNGSLFSSESARVVSESREISQTLLPKKIPEYTRIKNLIELEKYEYIIDEQRPEMKDIVYDIAAGFVRFDIQTHTFKTVTGQRLRFTEKELQIVDDIFTDIRPNSVFLHDTQILTYSTTDREHSQYTDQILQERINFYQQ